MGTTALRWRSARRRSALGTSYSATLPRDNSLTLALYERLAGLALLDRVVKRLTRGILADRERLDAMVRWTRENVTPQYAGPDRIVTDGLLGIVRRGYGHCDQTAHVFATLARLAGYEVRLLFLRAADGTSPHTVAEVSVDDCWVLADPWLGTMLADDGGRPLSVEDLPAHPAALRAYEGLLSIDASSFERGTSSAAFPYGDLRSALGALRSRLPRPRQVDPTERGSTIRRPGDAAILRMDDARCAHIEGRYAEAAAAYRGLLAMELPSDMRDAARFFLGFALLRAGAHAEAIAAFDAALQDAPLTPWAPSIHHYRAEATLASLDQERRSVDERW